MDYRDRPDYRCTTRDGDVYCEYDSDASRLNRMIQDCKRGRRATSPFAWAADKVESTTSIEIPPGAVEIAELGEVIDLTQQAVKGAGCAAMVSRGELRSGNDVWYLNVDRTDENYRR